MYFRRREKKREERKKKQVNFLKKFFFFIKINTERKKKKEWKQLNESNTHLATVSHTQCLVPWQDSTTQSVLDHFLFQLIHDSQTLHSHDDKFQFDACRCTDVQSKYQEDNVPHKLHWHEPKRRRRKQKKATRKKNRTDTMEMSWKARKKKREKK